MNDTIALILLGLVLFVVQTKYSHSNRDLADLARRNAWLAWKMMHPEPVSYTHLTLPTNREV